MASYRPGHEDIYEELIEERRKLDEEKRRQRLAEERRQRREGSAGMLHLDLPSSEPIISKCTKRRSHREEKRRQRLAEERRQRREGSVGMLHLDLPSSEPIISTCTTERRSHREEERRQLEDFEEERRQWREGTRQLIAENRRQRLAEERRKREEAEKRTHREEERRQWREERMRVRKEAERRRERKEAEEIRKLVEINEKRKKWEEDQTREGRLTKVLERFKIRKRPKDDNFDMRTRMQYDIAIKEGEEEDKTIRVMIIGCYGQGKTTLARRLLSKGIGNIESTNGIDIFNVSCSVHENKWKESAHADDTIYQSMQRLANIQIPESKKETARNENSTCQMDNTDEEGKGTQNYLTVESKNTQMRDKNTYFDAFKKMKKKEKSKDTDQYKLSLWDFGGQYIFYATHQLFHSKHAIYLLVFDLTRELHTQVTDEDYPGGTNHMRSMENYIEFWISSVHSYVGTKDGSKPNIILVGTHFDKLGDKNKADKYFEDVRKLFDGRKMGSHIHHETFAISGIDKNDQEVVRLKKTILEIGMKDRPLLPARWIPLEFELRKRQEESIVKYQDIVQMNDKDLEHPIPSKELKSFLKFHHANGTFIYFDEGVLADYVVVNPSFLVNAFKCIITSRKFCRKDKSLRSLWNELESRAILKQELLFEVWKNDQSSQFIKYKDALVAFLKKHGIISAALRFDEESGKNISLDYYIVPSFLKEPDNGEIKQFLENRSHTSVSLVYTFDNEAVVSTVYQRLTGAAVGTWPVVEFQSCRFLFENASVFRINLSYAGKFVRLRNTIELLILHMCKGGKISAVMPDFLRRFAENVFRVEFKKLQNIEDSQEVIPYTISFRCQHSLHKHEGSKKTYGLEMLKECKEKTVCCPDSIVHENIDIDKIVHEWFTYGMIDKKIPDRRLFDRELVELTQAIGSEWELLGNYLGVNRIALQHIKSNNDTTAMMILEMLRRWDQDKMEAATLNELVTAINRLPHESVDIDVVKNVIDGIYHL